MEIKGIVSSGAKFHSVNASEGLYNNNMLYKYIISERNIERINKCIPNENIKYTRLPFFIGGILRNIPFIGSKIPYNIISDVLFDEIASKYLKEDIDTKFFLGFNNYCLKQMVKLKKKGIKVLLDQRIAHVNKEIEIYEDEFNKLPSNLSKYMINRKLQEYEVADCILVGSEFVKETFIQNGIEEKKVKVVNYGYDPTIFKVKNVKNYKTQKNLKAIFVGQIGYRKGVKYLLQAVENLANKGINIDLTLVGNVDENFKDHIVKYRDYITYKPFMNVDDLVKEYNKNDIFIFPSLCEGSARVTYEAAACGLPLVVTHSSGSIVRDNITGIVIKEKSVESIEKALKILNDDRNLLQLLRKNILSEINSYTWEEYHKNLCNAIKSIVSC